MNRTIAAVLLVITVTVWADTNGAWFSFCPPQDEFRDDALLDLRCLHPGRAGSEGPIVARGDAFVCAQSGRAIRFLSVNGPNPWGAPWTNATEQTFFATRMAKLGVNHLRIGPVRGMHKMTEAHLAALQALIARCADQGIYSGITFYFPLEARMDIPEYGGKGVDSVVFFHPDARRIYEGWLKKIMTSTNPATGATLAQDPAVAYVELINEDNLFFFTFSPSKMPDATRCMLETQFGDWLATRYGSITNALKTWGVRAQRAGDEPAAGRVAVYDAYWFLDQDWARNQRNPARTADTLRFLTVLQRRFYADMKQLLRSWGFRGCVLATNWKAVEMRTLGALEKYANMAGDCLDRHAYFGGPHVGKNAGWQLLPGQCYQDRSALTIPDSLMKGVLYAGFPQFISEYQYPMPNRFSAELVWLGAHYGALTGHGGFSVGEVHTADWETTHRKFCAYTPVELGQFPAAAFVYRQGLVKQAQPAFQATVGVDNLYALRGTPVWDDMKLDEFRAHEAAGAKEKANRACDPLAWFVGPVRLRIAARAGETEAPDLSAFIDRKAQEVRSSTGELRWQWGKGVVTANAPAAQSACGFLGNAGEIRLADVRIRLSNEYGAVWLVSMDGNPLATSTNILLQVVTEERTAGWTTEPAAFRAAENGPELHGQRIRSIGTGPIEMRAINGSVALARADAPRLEVIALDHNGYQRSRLPGGATQIQLLPDCLWYVIRPRAK